MLTCGIAGVKKEDSGISSLSWLEFLCDVVKHFTFSAGSARNADINSQSPLIEALRMLATESGVESSVQRLTSSILLRRVVTYLVSTATAELKAASIEVGKTVQDIPLVLAPPSLDHCFTIMRNLMAKSAEAVGTVARSGGMLFLSRLFAASSKEASEQTRARAGGLLAVLLCCPTNGDFLRDCLEGAFPARVLESLAQGEVFVLETLSMLNSDFREPQFFWTEAHRTELRNQLTERMVQQLGASKSDSGKDVRSRSRALDVDNMREAVYEREVAAVKVRYTPNQMEPRVQGVYTRFFREKPDIPIDDSIGFVCKLISLLLQGSEQGREDLRAEWRLSLAAALERHMQKNWLAVNHVFSEDCTTIPRSLVLLCSDAEDETVEVGLTGLSLLFSMEGTEVGDKEGDMGIAAHEVLRDGGAKILLTICSKFMKNDEIRRQKLASKAAAVLSMATELSVHGLHIIYVPLVESLLISAVEAEETEVEGIMVKLVKQLLSAGKGEKQIRQALEAHVRFKTFGEMVKRISKKKK
uniref:Uncharacterized protein n=2 Tax=Palpitomonas bilix TaxID=652834 RepID=A0A7S3CVB9_9EUKA